MLYNYNMLSRKLYIITIYVKCTCKNKRRVQIYLEYIMLGSMIDIKFDTISFKSKLIVIVVNG